MVNQNLPRQVSRNLLPECDERAVQRWVRLALCGDILLSLRRWLFRIRAGLLMLPSLDHLFPDSANPITSLSGNSKYSALFAKVIFIVGVIFEPVFKASIKSLASQ